MRRCWAMDPWERPSFEELGGALEAALRGLPPPPDPLYVNMEEGGSTGPPNLSKDGGDSPALPAPPLPEGAPGRYVVCPAPPPKAGGPPGTPQPLALPLRRGLERCPPPASLPGSSPVPLCSLDGLGVPPPEGRDPSQVLGHPRDPDPPPSLLEHPGVPPKGKDTPFIPQHRSPPRDSSKGQKPPPGPPRPALYAASEPPGGGDPGGPPPGVPHALPPIKPLVLHPSRLLWGGVRGRVGAGGGRGGGTGAGFGVRAQSARDSANGNAALPARQPIGGRLSLLGSAGR